MVSEYTKNDHELLTVKNDSYNVYPTFYPVGQGMKNMPKAIQRIQDILHSM